VEAVCKVISFAAWAKGLLVRKFAEELAKPNAVSNPLQRMFLHHT